MSFLGGAAIILVSLWLLATLIFQFSAARQCLSAHDSLRLLPSWTFFAPNPGVHDYYIVFRGISGEEFLPWQNASIYQLRPKFAYVWHPQKRAKKALTDIVQSLFRTMRQHPNNSAALVLSLPYLMLLNIIERQVKDETDFCRFQFAIIVASGHVEKNLNFGYISDPHSMTVKC